MSTYAYAMIATLVLGGWGIITHEAMRYRKRNIIRIKDGRPYFNGRISDGLDAVRPLGDITVTWDDQREVWTVDNQVFRSTNIDRDEATRFFIGAAFNHGHGPKVLAYLTA